MRRLVALLLFSIAAIGCIGEPSVDVGALGLREIQIRMSDGHETQLVHGGKKKAQVPARATVDGESVPGWISISGNGTLDHIKKTYRFDEASGTGSVKYSAQAQDRSFLRSLLGARVLEELGIETPEVEPVVLSMNGRFVGLFLRIERINRAFFERRDIEPVRLYKSKTWRASFKRSHIGNADHCFEAKIGELVPAEIDALIELANAEPTDESLERLRKILDVDEAVRYLAAQLFLANWDGFSNNIHLLREEGSAPFRLIAWDWERSYSELKGIGFLLSINRLFGQIARHPSLAASLKAQLRALQEESFPRERIEAILDEEARRISRAYQADPFLGGQGHDPFEEKEKLLAEHGAWSAKLADYIQTP